MPAGDCSMRSMQCQDLITSEAEWLLLKQVAISHAGEKVLGTQPPNSSLKAGTHQQIISPVHPLLQDIQHSGITLGSESSYTQ